MLVMKANKPRRVRRKDRLLMIIGDMVGAGIK